MEKEDILPSIKAVKTVILKWTKLAGLKGEGTECTWFYNFVFLNTGNEESKGSELNGTWN